jgi:hypothetical protein
MVKSSSRRRKIKERTRLRGWVKGLALVVALVCLLWLVGRRKDRVMETKMSSKLRQAGAAKGEETEAIKKSMGDFQTGNGDALVCLSYEVYGKGKLLLFCNHLFFFFAYSWNAINNSTARFHAQVYENSCRQVWRPRVCQ